MTNISKPVIFFGTEQFSLITLQALIDANIPIAAVVTKPDSPQGRGHRVSPPPVKTLAEVHAIPVWQPTKLTEITESIRQLDHPVGVLVSYGKIIPQSIIDLFSPGIINLHPSLLPRYRGPSPIESAILNGDSATGVSIMQLNAQMDAGPVYAQATYNLHGNETAEELYDALGKNGAQLLIDLLPQITDGSLLATAQDEETATYCSLIQKTDGVINWEEAATEIERKIRAYHIWPKSRTKLGATDCIIREAEVFDTDAQLQPGALSVTKTLVIGCGENSLLIKTVQPIGKKEMPAQAFLNGYLHTTA